MLRRKPPMVRTTEKAADPIACLLTEGAFYEGTVWSPAGVRVECSITGSIITPGRVFISDKGRVNGSIFCGELMCDGVVEGEIVCVGKVRMGGTSCVKGTIHTKLFENESNERLLCSIQILTKEAVENMGMAIGDQVVTPGKRLDISMISGATALLEAQSNPFGLEDGGAEKDID